MYKAQLVKEVKELLGKAETEKGLNLLAEFMVNKPEYRQLSQLVVQAQAQFQRAQRAEIQGLTSSEQTKLSYNQVIRQTLQVVEWLEEGNLRPEGSIKEPSSRRWPLVIGGTILLLILAGGGYWWQQSQQSESEGPLSRSCPVEFRAASAFKILLVPFQALNDNKLKPHVTIAERLDGLKNEYNIECDLKYYPIIEDDPSSYPVTTEDASQRATNCQAQLIIWGTTESSSEGAIINTRYKFIKGDGQLELSKLKLTEDSRLAKVSSISSIAASGVLTQAIEESIKLLFGLIAHENEDWPTAIEMLEEFDTQDSAASLVKGMLLAEGYLASDQEDKAWESYNSVLEQNPGYALARNNRGVLNYQKGNYVEATEDLTVALEQDSSNVDALQIRGAAYLQADQLKKARLDLLKVRSLKSPDSQLNQKIEEVDKKIEEEEKAKASAEAELRVNPNNLSAWNQKAVSSQRLGNYSEAVIAGEAILNRDPDNVDAFVQLINAYRSAGDAGQIEKVIQRAEAAGISRKRLEELMPSSIIPLKPSRFVIPRKIE